MSVGGLAEKSAAAAVPGDGRRRGLSAAGGFADGRPVTALTELARDAVRPLAPPARTAARRLSPVVFDGAQSSAVQSVLVDTSERACAPTRAPCTGSTKCRIASEGCPARVLGLTVEVD